MNVWTIFKLPMQTPHWVSTEESVTKGSIITIGFGPFLGFRGVVDSLQSKRVAVRIIVGGREVLVELDRSMVESRAESSPGVASN